MIIKTFHITLNIKYIFCSNYTAFINHARICFIFYLTYFVINSPPIKKKILTLKVIVHPERKMLSSTHPQVVPSVFLLLNTKEDIWKNVG